MRRALCLILAAATVMGAATACVGPTPIPTLPPQPTATPVFASEEEALAAAEASYTAYINASDEIGHEGWQDTSRFASVATGAALDDELSTAAELASNGWRLVGVSDFDTVTLQQYSQVGEEATVVVYLCLDVSGTDVLDPEGNSMVAADRPDRLPLEVEFVGTDGLLVSRSELWSGETFC